MSTTASTIIIEHYAGETVRNVTNGKMFVLMKEGIASPTNHTITLNGLGAKFAACNKKAPAYTGPVSAIWEGATMGVAEIIPVGSKDHVC